MRPGSAVAIGGLEPIAAVAVRALEVRLLDRPGLCRWIAAKATSNVGNPKTPPSS
ncbi:MAG: hypothetical protein ABL997_09390 [Planctomycetota bacterium]